MSLTTHVLTASKKSKTSAKAPPAASKISQDTSTKGKEKTTVESMQESDTDKVLHKFENKSKKEKAKAATATSSDIVEFKEIGMPELEKPKSRALQVSN